MARLGRAWCGIYRNLHELTPGGQGHASLLHSSTLVSLARRGTGPCIIAAKPRGGSCADCSAMLLQQSVGVFFSPALLPPFSALVCEHGSFKRIPVSAAFWLKPFSRGPQIFNPCSTKCSRSTVQWI